QGTGNREQGTGNREQGTGILYHLPLATCLMSHVPCLMSHVSCPMSHVPSLMSHVSCPMSHVPCLMSHVSCPMSHVPYHLSLPMNVQESLQNLRHSTAHLLAAAVIELYPGAKHTIGPAIENGFYYDFDLSETGQTISEEDFAKIENTM